MEEYILLPFNFKQFDNDTVLLVNQAGEHLFLPLDIFKAFYDKKLEQASKYYKALKAKHFLTTEQEKKRKIMQEDFLLFLLYFKLFLFILKSR